MDSNKAGTGTFYLTVVLVVLTVILVLLGLAVWLYPNPKMPTLTGGVLMKAFLGICILIVVGLQILVAFLIRGRLRKRVAQLETQLAGKGKAPALPETLKTQTKLTFEIDEKNSQVRVGDGHSEVRRIYADIKLRCFKATDSVMAVRGFHISLHRAWPLGDEATVVAQEDWIVGWQDPGMQLVSTNEPWTIREPSTDYRTYHFSLDITPKIQFGLSADHFLRVTMDAVGQEPVSQPVYVNDWAVPSGGFSAISLKPPEEFPLEAQKEISRLKETIRSYEKTNETLGRFNEKYRWLTELAKKQETEIDHWVKVAKCERGDLNLTVPLGSAPNVILCIFVTNKSVLDISLSDELGGVVKFEDLELEGSKKVINSVTDLMSGETRCFTIRQRLSPSDVKVIADAQNAFRPLFFNFDQLEVSIIGGELCPDIKPKALLLRSSSALAFPTNLAEHGQRIRALSEIRGSVVQLCDVSPLTPDVLERWQKSSLRTLENVLSSQAAEKLWEQITHGQPIPVTVFPLRSWLESCIVELGGILADETGEYVNRRALNSE